MILAGDSGRPSGDGGRGPRGGGQPVALGRSALLALVLLALALAPATTTPDARAQQRPAETPDTLDLSARWPVLLDASTRTLAPLGGERALPRDHRRPAHARRRPCPRFAPAPAALPRARSLPELGKRQDDGG